MAKTFTKRDVQLLDYDTAQTTEDQGAFTVIDASATRGLGSVDTRFIYLKSKCTSAGAEQAARRCDTSTYVVRPFTLKIADETLRRIFGRETQIYLQEDLIWKSLGRKLGPYLTDMRVSLPRDEHFVSPREDGHGSEGAELMKSLVRYLRGDDATQDGKLGVLSAHAGVGKTTVARELLHRLVDGEQRSMRIPIYIEAEHWSKLNLEEATGLRDVIAWSLDRVSPGTQMLSEDLFRHALRQGYLSFIFDGFDELCSQSQSPFDPRDTLKELRNITSSQSGARILLTTRTLFWDAKVDGGPESDGVHLWTMAPFNSQQAKSYLRGVFKGDTRARDRSLGLYQSLNQDAEPRERSGSIRAQFVNLPLCVRMLADFVKDSAEASPHATVGESGSEMAAAGSSPVLQSVVEQICKRETARHALVSSVRQQLASFRDVAVQYHRDTNPQFDLDDLFTTPGGFDEADRQRIGGHALVVGAGAGDKYRLRYEFLGPHFRADPVVKWIRGREVARELPEPVVEIMVTGADGQSTVLEQVMTFLDADEDLSRVLRKCEDECTSQSKVASFLFHVAQRLAGNDPSIKTKEERTRVLFGGIGAMEDKRWLLRDWEFHGVMENLDLGHVTFRNCKFHDATFRKCEPGSGLAFQRCRFDGTLRSEPEARAWKGIIVSDDCDLTHVRETNWKEMLSGPRVDHAERHQEILRHGLRKFWQQGHIKWGGLRRDNWKKGRLGQFGEAERLLEVMLSCELVRIEVASELEVLVFDRGSTRDLQNYMDNRQMTGKIGTVYSRLLRETKR